MLYLEFWNSYWQALEELSQGRKIGDEPAPTAEKPAAKTAPAATDALPLDEKYHYLTEYGTQVLCLLNAKKGCTYLSRNFETILGQECSARLGEKFFSIVHSDYRTRLKEALAERPKGDDPYPFRCKLQHGDKKWYWYLLLLHPKKDSPHEYVCIIENIHDSMLAQNTLQKAKLEAELALRGRSEFLANMSHELRTPLNAVIGFSQIIESEMFGKIDNPQYLEYVKHIQESGYDLLAKIEDLLEIANIDAGRVVLTREEVHASDILRHVTEAQAHHAHSAQVTLVSEPPKTDMLLFIDRLKLQHILGHLVANAIKFSAPESKIILKAAKSDKGELMISVQDSGAGIAESKLTAIAAALKEESCWTTIDNRSVGLGLALTREFVALHGGEVEVKSTAGKGTTVELTLPKDCIRAASVKSEEYLLKTAN